MEQIISFQATPFSSETLQSARPFDNFSVDANKLNNEHLTAALYITSTHKSLYDDILFYKTFTTYPYVFVLIRDGVYVEHLYVWLVNNSNNSGSVTNILGDVKNIYTFLNSINMWTKTMTKDKPSSYLRLLRVLQPSNSMVAILHRAGFILAKTVGNEESLSWLFNNSSLGNMPLVDNLLFRKYDYISLVE